MSLEDKVVLITGANGGLGIALVEYAIISGAKKIYCYARKTDKLQKLQQNNPNLIIEIVDITDKSRVEEVALTIEYIDILINNAGANSGKIVFDDEKIDFEVNLFGTLNICRSFENKINKNGAIINITSVAALVNFPIMGLYSASKAALHSVTQALRAHMALKEIEVYEVFPGPIDTDMVKDLDMPKTSASDIAKEIFTSFAKKEYEIYPDSFAKMVQESLLNDPKSIESEFAKSIL